MKRNSTIEKLWYRLSELANGPTITGETPELKAEWLTLALACGMQLASQLPLADIEGTIRPGNDGTSGDVDIVGNVIYSDYDEEEVVSLSLIHI